MDNAKVDEVLNDYLDRLRIMQFTPYRHTTSHPVEGFVVPLRHAAWMCQEALTFPAEKLEKKMRWLGFIQGIFFVTNFQSIDQMKKDNMPKGEEFKK